MWLAIHIQSVFLQSKLTVLIKLVLEKWEKIIVQTDANLWTDLKSKEQTVLIVMFTKSCNIVQKGHKLVVLESFFPQTMQTSSTTCVQKKNQPHVQLKKKLWFCFSVLKMALVQKQKLRFCDLQYQISWIGSVQRKEKGEMFPVCKTVICSCDCC